MQIMFKSIEKFSASWLAEKLNLDIKSNSSNQLLGVNSLDANSKDCLVFSTGDATSESNVVIGKLSNQSTNLIVSESPRLDFIRAILIIDTEIGFKRDSKSPIIHSSAQIGRNVVIENGVSIGKNTIIEPNSVIFSGTVIGDNCFIRANSTIGSDGFGFERDNSGKPIKFVHLGGVVIGNNVEIGANTCIAKGTLGNTIIEDNVKIDNLVHVAHNCIIRDGAFIIASSVLCGGVEVKSNAWVAPNATISQKLTIGNNAVVGLSAVVTKSVESRTVVAGNPAKVLRKIND
jgi:UDP-3-O-[3-hydroxymyristoyl] glucosamine N-acyltransferase